MIGIFGNFSFTLDKKINPLAEGLLWIRGMDVEPVLTTREELTELCDQGC